jgi:hypothetical protein
MTRKIHDLVSKVVTNPKILDDPFPFKKSSAANKGGVNVGSLRTKTPQNVRKKYMFTPCSTEGGKGKERQADGF